VTDNNFDNLIQPRLKALAQLGSVRRYRKGVLLIEEGDATCSIYIVLHGRLKAFTSAASSADREVTFGVYGPGGLVGEMSLDGGPRSASVVSLEETVCSVITKELLRDYIRQEPEFAFDLLAKVIAKARRATLSTRALALTDAYGRLSELLSGLAYAQPNGEKIIQQRISHSEMASQIGCSREMVSRLLKDLKTGGYIGQTATKQLLILKQLPSGW
jgi:CRP/FNR family transcriptional regulator, cyclic AMP receptor protein